MGGNQNSILVIALSSVIVVICLGLSMLSAVKYLCTQYRAINLQICTECKVDYGIG